MMDTLTLEVLQAAIAGRAAALRSITDLQPAGGPGDKVFPPTYEGGRYALEERLIAGERVPCVLLDSVASQANRLEFALLDAWERGRIRLPLIEVDFSDTGIPGLRRVTSLEAPHRIADAILRDSVLDDGQPFSRSRYAESWGAARVHDATALYELCPTALIFGTWGSPEKPGGLGAKFARLIVSEIVGLHAIAGVKTRSRIDPLHILSDGLQVYEARGGGWTLDEGSAQVDEKGKPILLRPRNSGDKPGRPSIANHGNVTPSVDTMPGGVTISKAIQTTVLSLAGLRRLRFPLNGSSGESVDAAARTALAALALAAMELAREAGYDLRSRCMLVPAGGGDWELLDARGESRTFRLTAEEAVGLYEAASDAARSVGLPPLDLRIRLRPAEQLVALVRRSHEVAVFAGGEEA